MATGSGGVDEVRVAAAGHDPASNRRRLRLEHIVMLAAYVDGEAVAYGSLSLDDQAPMAEIVAVGTLPAFRRRGLGSILTSALVDEADRRGVTTTWLSAADANVADLYARLGFDRVGTYLMASYPDGRLPLTGGRT